MSLSWSYDVSGDVLVLHLAGYLGVESVARFDGALGWVLAQQPSAVVIDTAGLFGWSSEGQGAVADAARLICQCGVRVCLCGTSRLSPPAAAPAGASSVQRDVAAALVALEPGTRAQRV